MVILDTSVWIEFFKANDEIYSAVKILLESRKIIGLEWIFAELLQGAKNKRESDFILDYWNNISKIDAQGIWIEAGRYSNTNRLLSKGMGLIDAAIMSAALRLDAKVWTLDRKLHAVLPVHLRFQSGQEDSIQ